MSNFTSLSSSLATLLGTISEIEVVYEYEANAADAYPAAMIIATGNDAEYASTNSNDRWFNFTVRIIQEIPQQGSAEAERILKAAVDNTITAIDNDFSLGGSVQMVEAVTSSWGRDDREAGIIRFADLLVRVMIQVDLT